MTQENILIAYRTKGNATKEAADLLAKVFREEYDLSVDLVNLKEASPEPANYSSIVVGTGVRMGRIYREALDFLGRDFSGKKVAVFLSSLEAGEEGKREQALEKYLEKEVRRQLNVNTIATEAFGGRIMILGFTIKNNIDRERIIRWAKNIAPKLAEKSSQ